MSVVGMCGWWCMYGTEHN